MPLQRIHAPNLSLDHTLSSGQTFCWHREGETWVGWIHHHPCRLRLKGEFLTVESPSIPEKQVRDYFQLHSGWDAIVRSFPQDPHLTQAIRSTSGLRCIQDPWWECIGNFICSALKQISQNIQINASMRQRFGEEIRENLFTYPTPSRVASLSEKDLRSCKLGFRAKNLLKAARQIESGEFDWNRLSSLSTEEASLELQKLAGVGNKVAHCILLHAAARWDAFPIDVWVERFMKQLYFPKRRKTLTKVDIHRFAREHFGAHCGIAQLFLFHWFRTQSPLTNGKIASTSLRQKSPKGSRTSKSQQVPKY